jgi:transcriptional regulator with PAS, ATPase and Fis domain
MHESIVVQLQSMLDTRDNPAVVVDHEYRIVAANAAYCASYGIPQDAIVGKACHEVSHRSDRPCHMNGEECPHRTVFSQGQPSEVLHTHVDFHGRPDYVRIHAYPLSDGNGQTYLMESIHRLAPKLEIGCDEMRMAGNTPAFLRFFEDLATAARSNAPIWLYGESGVGKELAARFLHEHSSRAGKAYVELNCASIPESLCESELFGYERGAFTGGHRSKRGLFELADGGTLFLDEIGDLPLVMQGKLLRVLDSGEYRPLGSEKALRCNVRVVAATNRDLQQMVGEGSFRLDLYYRIAGYKVTIPPLRERKGDIAAISGLILRRLESESGQQYSLGQGALEVLEAYGFPGNIRELRSVLIKAAVQCERGVIKAGDIDFQHGSGCACVPGVEEKPSARAVRLETNAGLQEFGEELTIQGGKGLRENEPLYPLQQYEETSIRRLMRQFGNRRVVAEKLGISERTLYRKLKKYGIETLKSGAAILAVAECMAYVPVAAWASWV